MDSNDVFDQPVKIGFAPVLTYAACEWFLIFLMFIDALLSYLVVWFARYCRLQMPCFLCSKFLHPLHWRLLLCRNHKSEVSSFMSCHNHDNLADCRGMCDDCLLSFTKMSGPNPDMNRSLLGKLGYDLLSKSQFTHPRSCSCCNKPWRTRHHTQRLIQLGSRGRNSTSKPNIPAPRHLTRRSSGSLKKIRDHKATSGSEYVDIGSRSDGMAHVGYTELKLFSDSESEFLFSTDEAFFPITDFNVEPSEKRAHKSHSRKSFEHKKMSKHKKHDLQDNHYKNNHVEDYKNVKLSMPELNVVDETKHKPVEAEDHGNVLSELINMSEARLFPLGLPREDDARLAAQNENEAELSGNSSPFGGEFLSPSGENSAFREFQIQAHDDSNSAQNIFSSAVNTEAPEASMEQKVSEHLDVSGSDASAPSGDEENVGEGDSKPLPSNNLSDPLEQEESSEKENEVNENNVAEEYFSNEEEDEVNEHSKPLASENVSSSFAEKQLSEEEDGSNDYSAAKSHSSKEDDADNRDSEPVTSENFIGSATEEHSCREEQRETEPLATPKTPNEESSLEHSDNDYLVAKSHSSKEEDAHNRDSETVTSDNVTCSAAVEHSGKEEHGETEFLASPKISNEESSLEHNDNDSSKVTETHNSPNESPVLNHSASVESFLSISSDIEGEHLVDLLKKQLEHDRKCLKELSKELEEERNASAIATNQAMAMITRLQEEKAALHMEVLQYLRMMDEQTEHDVDALERANNILTDREKEIQDLEMELEYYRLKYPDEPREEILASMGILEDIETSGTPTIDETSNKDPTDTTPSPGI